MVTKRLPLDRVIARRRSRSPPWPLDGSASGLLRLQDAAVSTVTGILHELEGRDRVTELMGVDLERSRRRRRLGIADDLHRADSRSFGSGHRARDVATEHLTFRRDACTLFANDVEILGDHQRHE